MSSVKCTYQMHVYQTLSNRCKHQNLTSGEWIITEYLEGLKMTLGRMTYKQQNSCEVYVRVQSAQLSRVNNTGCWLLLVSTVVSIKIFLIVIHSHRMMMDYGILFVLVWLLDCFYLTGLFFIIDYNICKEKFTSNFLWTCLLNWLPLSARSPYYIPTAFMIKQLSIFNILSPSL